MTVELPLRALRILVVQFTVGGGCEIEGALVILFCQNRMQPWQELYGVYSITTPEEMACASYMYDLNSLACTTADITHHEGRPFKPVATRPPRWRRNSSDVFQPHQPPAKRQRTVAIVESPGLIDAEYRRIAIKQILQITAFFEYSSDVAYYAVTYMDRFLAIHRIAPRRLRLLAVVCLWIAVKMEETTCLLVSDIIEELDYKHTRKEIIQMERTVLNALEWKLCTQVPPALVGGILEQCNIRSTRTDGMEKLYGVSCRFTVVGTLDPEFARFPPPVVAAAGIVLGLGRVSHAEVDLEKWTGRVAESAGVAVGEVTECYIWLRDLLASQLPPNETPFSWCGRLSVKWPAA